MPSKKKKKQTKKKPVTTKQTNKNARTTVKTVAAKKKSTKSAKKKTTQKKKPSTATAKRRTRASVSSEKEIQREIRNKQRIAAASASGRQAGDMQNLSRAEQADSESVDELVEEGNVFEAGAVAGVEEADNEDEREVHTHEVPEDDVPEEYLDKD
jgi:hypothetical protein